MNTSDPQRLPDSELIDILAFSPDATAIYTGEDVIIQMANDKMISYWGKDRSVIGMPLMNAVPELQGQEFVSILQKVWQTGVTYEASQLPAELNVNGKLETFYFDFVYRALHRPDGSLWCILHTAADVTEKVRYSQRLKARELENEELNYQLAVKNDELRTANKELVEMNQALSELYIKLADSEGLFRSIFEQAPLGLTMLSGPDMVVEQANQPILDIWGRREAEVLGKPVILARPELDGQTVTETLNEVYQNGKIKINNEVKSLYKDGEQLREAYVNSVYSPLRNHDGTIRGVLAIVDDVTQRIAERQRRELMEEQFRISVESAELGTWFVDAETRAFVTSARLRELFGFYAQDEITLEDAVNQIREDYRPAVEAAIDAAIENETSYDIEYPVIGYHDQKLRWIRATGKLYPGEHGMKPHFSGVVTEITDRKTEERRKYDFIAIVSHELKTPLTSAKGYVQMLVANAHKNNDAFTVTALEKVERQIEKMLTLIKGFLDVARLESSQIRLDKESFVINELIEECASEVSVFATRHQIMIDGADAIHVIADREKIGQVIINLLNNAIKYSPKGGTINVSCTSDAQGISVSVKDQGMGVNEQDKDRLFNRFYRVESKHTKTISGFGIGLYLSAEIIRLHEGQIGLESEVGKGSTFYFKLPPNQL